MSESHLLPDGQILRYTFRERCIHWVAGASYLYLLLTGLAFWSPWLFWITLIFGGATVSRELHPWAGLLWAISVLMMYRMWGSEMRESPGDKAWWGGIRHYIRNEDDEMPSVARFNPGQKLLFWGFLWCGVVMLLSGLILWFPHWIPWSLRFLRYGAVIVHPVAALLTIGLFMMHVYMGTAAEPGAFGSMIRGSVSRAWARELHRIWFDQLVGGGSGRK